MLRHRLATLALLLLPAFALAADRLPMPAPIVGIAAAPVAQVTGELSALNREIGGHPARFASEAARQAAYRKWAALAQQVWMIEAREPKAEATLFLLGELYRQGHLLEVKGAASRADAALGACLAHFPDAVPCHFAAAYFYLAAHPRYAPRAEASLLRLRELRKPEVDPEVERGLALAYLYQHRKEEALRQVNYLLTLTPEAEWLHTIHKVLVEANARGNTP